MARAVVAVSAVIGDRSVARDEVLAWEAERLSAAAAKISLPVPAGDLAQQRVVFTDSKIALGAEEIKRRLRRDLRIGEGVARAAVGLSHGRRALSVCDLHVAGGSAREFAQWFGDTSRADYVRSMVAAHPDHFLIRALPDGRQEVIETTGGSPAATRFLVDYLDTATLTTPREMEFSEQMAGVARSVKGLPIGGVRHQLRDEPGGFHARLCVEFPRFTMPRILSEHRKHLAIEFSNWVESAFNASH